MGKCGDLWEVLIIFSLILNKKWAVNNYFGEYECTLDDKGRIKLPVALVRRLPLDPEQRLVVNRGFENYIAIRPLDEWYRITAEISKLNPYVKRNREFQRYFYRGATELSLDNASRILLPKTLIEYAGIEKDIILTLHDYCVEAWDADKFTKLMDGDSQPEDFSDLAEKVMGEIFNKPEGE